MSQSLTSSYCAATVLALILALFPAAAPALPIPVDAPGERPDWEGPHPGDPPAGRPGFDAPPPFSHGLNRLDERARFPVTADHGIEDEPDDDGDDGVPGFAGEHGIGHDEHGNGHGYGHCEHGNGVGWGHSGDDCAPVPEAPAVVLIGGLLGALALVRRRTS